MIYFNRKSIFNKFSAKEKFAGHMKKNNKFYGIDISLEKKCWGDCGQ